MRIRNIFIIRNPNKNPNYNPNPSHKPNPNLNPGNERFVLLGYGKV